MIITGQLTIKCAECSEIITFTPTHSDFENVSGDEENKGRNTFLWKKEDEECPKCGNGISFEYRVVEYQGDYEDDIDLVGAEQPPIEKFEFDFKESRFDDYDADEDYPDFEEE
jgi:hypothetical protein